MYTLILTKSLILEKYCTQNIEEICNICNVYYFRVLLYTIFFENAIPVLYSILNCIKTIYLAFDRLLIPIYVILSTIYLYQFDHKEQTYR